jgi:ABC-type multidrug transport system permease subunit
MLRILLAKDLRRARRNPQPWIINLILPLAITALIGLAFGGSNNGGLGVIHFAVVNENTNRASEFLQRAAQSMASENSSNVPLDPIFTNRAEAMRELNADKISAVLVIPKNFLGDYLLGSQQVSLELIKNPAESIHPAVLEEGLGALVTTLNALSRNFQSEFPAWHSALEGEMDYQKVSQLVEQTGDRLKAMTNYIDPPLVSYSTENPDDETNKTVSASGTVNNDSSKKNVSNSIFPYLLIGMSAMFLLFLAGNAMGDLYRELRQRTFERYQTMRDSLFPFLASKAVFAVVMLLVCSAMLLGGGGLIFKIQWQHPFALAMLAFGYACFAAAFYTLLVALIPDERRAAVLGNLAGMGLSLMGGCLFPAEQLPAFLRDNITPLLPSYWFADTLRDLQYGDTAVAWSSTFIKLLATSAVLLALAAALFRRKFKTGLRA